jgi:hypothetical protein
VKYCTVRMVSCTTRHVGQHAVHVKMSTSPASPDLLEAAGAGLSRCRRSRGHRKFVAAVPDEHPFPRRSRISIAAARRKSTKFASLRVRDTGPLSPYRRSGKSPRKRSSKYSVSRPRAASAQQHVHAQYATGL